MKISIRHIVAMLCCCVGIAAPGSLGETLPLDGQWRFQLDRQDHGLAERWFAGALKDTIRLPGSLPAQGVGDDISVDTPWTGQIVDRSWFTSPQYAPYRKPGNIKLPFWLTPAKYYKGVAWYQRDVNIPSQWQGQRVVLYLERPHWQTQVFVDDRAFDSNDSLNTPHETDLGQLTPGRHTITIRVDNQMVIDIGLNSHDITDHTQGNWNGIVGAIELRTTPLQWIDDLQVYPHLASRSVTVRGKIGNSSGAARDVVLKLACQDQQLQLPIHADVHGASFEGELQLGQDAKLWDEFSPNLYQLNADLSSGDHKVVSFGLREIGTEGTQFVINGRKTFIRGTLECCIFPNTGHPPTDVGSWKQVISTAKSYGLNLLRFHSYCPPEAAFTAADQLGCYLQVETAWATVGDGKPVDQWIYRETDRILRYNGNHPSFLLMPYGNEPAGKHANEYLAAYVKHFRSIDPRRLWTSGSGWPQLPENQFDVTPDPRIQRWGHGLKSRINAFPPETRTDYAEYIKARPVPVISHEIGQWCVYPDFSEIPSYTGYLHPLNFEIFRDSLEAHHMGDEAQQFLMASGKLQALCYKEDIESALRTPGMGGFELLDVHDFPGQGTALVGVANALWHNKGYITPQQYSRFCNSTVPLVRLGKRVFRTDETLDADVEIAHFGPAPLADATVQWRLVGDSGAVAATGTLPTQTIPIGNGISLGSIHAPLASCQAPAHYKLVVSVQGTNSAAYENDWDVWLYPVAAATNAAAPVGITVVNKLDDNAVAVLKGGGKVLLLLPPAQVRNVNPPVKFGFSSIFWNTAWTYRQAPTTLGILCDPHDPLLADFPTEGYSNWQWWYLVHRASPMILDDFPPELRPHVQVIDDWVTNHRLGLEVEGVVDGGKLAICSIDLANADDPVTLQFRSSLFRYLASDDFRPTVALTVEQVRGLSTN